MYIKQLISDAEISKSFDLIKQLVDSIQENTFVAFVRRKEKMGYKLFALLEDDIIVSVIGIRIYEYFGCGKFLIIDDLITDNNKRSKGYGKVVFEWVKKYAKAKKCNEIHLESGVNRSRAHKFYFDQNMKIMNYNFTLNIN